LDWAGGDDQSVCISEEAPLQRVLNQILAAEREERGARLIEME
jgi:hypothetical protein